MIHSILTEYMNFNYHIENNKSQYSNNFTLHFILIK